jgi:hypothetical protein
MRRAGPAPFWGERDIEIERALFFEWRTAGQPKEGLAKFAAGEGADVSE